MLTFQTFNKINKLCVNDTLLGLYILSSSSLTIWFLFYLVYLIFIKFYRYIIIRYLIFYLFLLSYFFINNFNFNLVSVWLMIQAVNTTLQNGLLSIHPIYIYITYAYIYVIWVVNYKFYNIISNNITLSNYFSILYIILIGIYLGAFWASQELNWGGFWSWDPVELVSLFLFFWVLLSFHNKNTNFLNKPINHTVIVIVIIYFIIRLGVISTIHSFIKTNTNPFYIKASFIIISFFIYINKKKYYYVYNKKYIKCSKIHLVIILLSISYLCVYILLLLTFTSVYILNPIKWYFILIIISIYLLYVESKIQYHKHLFNLFFMLLSFFIIKINIITLIFLFLFLYRFYFFKKIQLHTILVISYLLFFLFFVNINIYNNNSIKPYKYNLILNNSNNSLILYNNYEVCFFLKNKVYFVKLKNILSHVSSFSIITNSVSSLFLFSKNNNIYFIFFLEIIHIIGHYLIILCLLIILNYKFLKFTGGCVKIY